MRPYAVEAYGNPASAHRVGRRARHGLEDAREQTAALLGAHPDEVIFTSGATEANNLALFGLGGDPPGHLLASPIEHPSVAEPLRQLAASGFALDWLPVDAQGVVDADVLTALIATRHAPARGDAGQPRNRGGAAGARPGGAPGRRAPPSTATRHRRSANCRSTSTISASRRWR